MNTLARTLTGAMVLALCLVPAAAAADEAAAGPGPGAVNGTPSLIVLPLKPLGVPEEVTGSLTELLVIELEKTKLWKVIAQEDLKAQMEQASLQQLMGIEDDQKLVEQISTMMVADFLLRGTVGKLGSTYVLTLTLLDMKTGEAVRRVEQRLTGRPDDLIGSLHSAVIAVALEEQGIAPDITGDLVDSLNIAQKRKTLFIHLKAGYEIPVGPVTDSGDLAYLLPNMLTLNLSAGWQVLPYMQLVFESGASLSIAEQFAQQTSEAFLRNYNNEKDSANRMTVTAEPQVMTTQFDYGTMRIPFNVMLRFQPPTGRMLPYAMVGLGFSWQRYTVDQSKIENLYTDRSLNGVCPAPYASAGGDQCLRIDYLDPEHDSISYWNLQLPVAVGVDYLLSHHFGVGIEARYTMTYSLTRNDRDLDVNFYSEEPLKYTSVNGDAIQEFVGDTKPIRRLNHGISVTAGFFYYF